jgi:hypothetical protein
MADRLCDVDFICLEYSHVEEANDDFEEEIIVDAENDCVGLNEMMRIM